MIYTTRRYQPCVCAAAHLPGIVGSNPTGGMDFVSCVCCVLLSRGLCNELITRPEKAYRLWCVVMCHLETEETLARIGPQCHKKKVYYIQRIIHTIDTTHDVKYTRYIRTTHNVHYKRYTLHTMYTKHDIHYIRCILHIIYITCDV
jgi:hypothetical protein